MKQEEYNKKYFEKIGYYDNPYNKLIINYLRKYKKAGNLLELGCAEGYVLKYASKYFDTCGIDISKYAIEKAKINSPKSSFKVINVEKNLKIFLKNKKFDVIIALDILEHLKNPKNIITIINNSLRSGGIFIFRIPNLSSINLKILSLINKRDNWGGYKDKTHISLLTVKKWGILLNKSNFEFRLLPYFPLKKAKKFVAKFLPFMFFIPKIFANTNDSITFICIKK